MIFYSVELNNKLLYNQTCKIIKQIITGGLFMPKTVRINKEACIGCGLCQAMSVTTFDFDDDGKAKVVAGEGSVIPAGCETEVEDSAASCPVQAIEIN